MNNPENFEQKLQQIFTLAKTFRKHPLIIFEQRPVSPYSLACNGFVNKNFKDEQKLQGSQLQFKQINCICKESQCLKSFKINNLQNKSIFEDMTDDSQLQQLLIEHDEKCQYYRKQCQKLSSSQIFQVAHLFYNKILQSYQKDQFHQVEKLNILWKNVQNLITDKDPANKIIYYCYKFIDKTFNVVSKTYQKYILLSIFGWRFNTLNISETITLKCHFCGKKIQNNFQDSFDFYISHNSWCLIKDSKYHIWKQMLKNKYKIDSQSKSRPLQIKQSINDENDKNKQKFIYRIPRSQKQIQIKQVQYELFELVKPSLQKIDQIISVSAKNIQQKRQRKGKKNSNQQQICQQEIEYNFAEQFLQKQKNLAQIGKNCQQIIRDFINSIKIK